MVPPLGSNIWPMVAPTLASIISPAASIAQRMVAKKKPMAMPIPASRSSMIAQPKVPISCTMKLGWRAKATPPKVRMIALRTVAGMVFCANRGMMAKAKPKRAEAMPTSSNSIIHPGTPCMPPAAPAITGAPWPGTG